MTTPRDHGGGLDAARARWGGSAEDWIDLSTGINPTPYPIPHIPAAAWTRLPDLAAQSALIQAARDFWQVPEHLEILAVPGASAAIARLPAILAGRGVAIPAPTYNEHAAAFAAHGWQQTENPQVTVIVHPNNPDGRLWQSQDLNGPMVIDESFCDVMPDQSLIGALEPHSVLLKSFGKFWGLAGIRLGFVIGAPDLIARLRDLIGPWAVSGPALEIGMQALRNTAWAEATRGRLARDADRLDGILGTRGAQLVGGTTLFRLYRVDDAAAWQDRLARGKIWSRIFPYSDHWLRLGLPPKDGWSQLERAL